MYKNNYSILSLTKGSYKFTTSDFPAKNPHTYTRNYSYMRPLFIIVYDKSFTMTVIRYKEKWRK